LNPTLVETHFSCEAPRKIGAFHFKTARPGKASDSICRLILASYPNRLMATAS
jgi:hypothetical protein